MRKSISKQFACILLILGFCFNVLLTSSAAKVNTVRVADAEKYFGNCESTYDYEEEFSGLYYCYSGFSAKAIDRYIINMKELGLQETAITIEADEKLIAFEKDSGVILLYCLLDDGNDANNTAFLIYRDGVKYVAEAAIATPRIEKKQCNICWGDGKCACGDGKLMGYDCNLCGGTGKCNFCKGKGYFESKVNVQAESNKTYGNAYDSNSEEGHVCYSCDGSGKCFICHGEGEWIGGKCFNCGGSGSCQFCHGDGYCDPGEKYKDVPDGVCAICEGSGICQVCYGRGKFFVATYGQGGSNYVTCEGCNGNRKCKYCKGTGND